MYLLKRWISKTVNFIVPKEKEDKKRRKEDGRETIMRKVISNSFLLGFIRILDIKGTKRWPHLSDGKQEDYEAIRSDWENVGKFIQEGTNEYRRSKQ